MSATMASANLRATGVAPRVAARSNATARVAQMFRTAGPNAEQKLGDAMVAAAHQRWAGAGKRRNRIDP